MYAIFHPDDELKIKKCLKSTKYKKVTKELVDFANGLYENKDFIDKPEVKLRPIVPQPAHFIAKNEDELKNVKVVVLTTNPGYTPRIQDSLPNDKIEEQEIMYKTLIGEGKFVPWKKPELPDGIIEKPEEKKDKDNLKEFLKPYWHYNHFVNAGHSWKPTDLSFKKLGFIENAEQEIMQIDYFPYQTKDSSSIPKCFLKSSKEDLLPSQEINFDLLKFMINETDAIFICRKYDMWKKLIKDNYGDSLKKFEERAFVFNRDSDVYLATSRIRRVSKQQKIDKIKLEAKQDNQIYFDKR